MNDSYNRLVTYIKSEKFADKCRLGIALIRRLNEQLRRANALDFLAPLLIRLYLVPVFWMAGVNKFSHFGATADWFGSALGMPLPYLMVFLAATAELLGAIFLLVGFATRWISLPLMFTMVVAAFSVHWQNGWLAIASGSGPFATERTMAAVERLAKAKEILMSSGNYDWLTETGNFVVLNNGIEFAATYFLMLLVLFFAGGGRYVSVDYWMSKRFGAN